VADAGDDYGLLLGVDVRNNAIVPNTHAVEFDADKAFEESERVFLAFINLLEYSRT
jgi:hypothetical protein